MVIILGLALVSFGEDRIGQPEPQSEKANSEKANIKSDPPPVEKDAQRTTHPWFVRVFDPASR